MLPAVIGLPSHRDHSPVGAICDLVAPSRPTAPPMDAEQDRQQENL